MLLHDYQASFRESAATRVIRTPSVHADALQKVYFFIFHFISFVFLCTSVSMKIYAIFFKS